MSAPVVPEGRALPDVVLRVSLHEALGAHVERSLPAFTEVQRRVLRHFRDRTATVLASPRTTGRSTALALGVVSAWRKARDSGAAPPSFVWCACNEDVDSARARLAQYWEASGGGEAPTVEVVTHAAALGEYAQGEVAPILVVDGLGEPPSDALIALAGRARATIAVVEPSAGLRQLATSLIGRTGGTFADCTEYARIRVRAWAPVRNDPFPAQDSMDRGIVSELVRIAWSDGPVHVWCAAEARGLVAAAQHELTHSVPPPAVSGVRARSVEIAEITNDAETFREGEVVVIGAPRSVQWLARIAGPLGGLTQEGARLGLFAQSVSGLAICAVARRRLNRGDVGDEVEGNDGFAASLAQDHHAFLGELRLRVAADDSRGERAALWLVSEYGLNRGNARALVAWLRHHLDASFP